MKKNFSHKITPHVIMAILLSSGAYNICNAWFDGRKAPEQEKIFTEEPPKEATEKTPMPLTRAVAPTLPPRAATTPETLKTPPPLPKTPAPAIPKGFDTGSPNVKTSDTELSPAPNPRPAFGSGATMPRPIISGPQKPPAMPTWKPVELSVPPRNAEQEAETKKSVTDTGRKTLEETAKIRADEKAKEAAATAAANIEIDAEGDKAAKDAKLQFKKSQEQLEAPRKNFVTGNDSLKEKTAELENLNKLEAELKKDPKNETLIEQKKKILKLNPNGNLETLAEARKRLNSDKVLILKNQIGRYLEFSKVLDAQIMPLKGRKELSAQGESLKSFESDKKAIQAQFKGHEKELKALLKKESAERIKEKKQLEKDIKKAKTVLKKLQAKNAKAQKDLDKNIKKATDRQTFAGKNSENAKKIQGEINGYNSMKKQLKANEDHLIKLNDYNQAKSSELSAELNYLKQITP